MADERAAGTEVRENTRRMPPLSRFAWLATVGICFVTALILLLSGYTGYAGVTAAGGIAPPINLFSPCPPAPRGPPARGGSARPPRRGGARSRPAGRGRCGGPPRAR